MHDGAEGNLTDLCEPLRPATDYRPYPPYHTGPYLEEAFYRYATGQQFDRHYLPIFWTSCYLKHKPGQEIQAVLDRVDPHQKYFTVCQHADGPREKLPPDTLVFSPGRTEAMPEQIPIPLTCSRIPSRATRRQTYLASFVGSLTHPVRRTLHETWANDRRFIFAVQEWRRDVPAEMFHRFLEATSASRFALCPRGYGPTSFRLYEAMQLGAVPVYISDEHCLPWADELDWEAFCVLLSPKQVPRLRQILEGIPEQRVREMQRRAHEVYDTHCALDRVCERISDLMGRRETSR